MTLRTGSAVVKNFTYYCGDQLKTCCAAGRHTQWRVERPSGNGYGLADLNSDYEGRLHQMKVPGQGSPYHTNTYNGLGTRVKVVDNGYGSGTRKYVRGGAGVTDPVLRMTTGADNSPTWTNYTPGVSE